MHPDAQEDGRADALVRRVSMLPGVADVRYDREWLARLASGLAAVRGAGFGLAVVMALAAAVTVASVVRLGLNARRSELEIMQLVGSPIAFIRGPLSRRCLPGGPWRASRVRAAVAGVGLRGCLVGKRPAGVPRGRILAISADRRAPLW